ncbi:restriction endonuclease [Novosphingobium sp. KACC 22771]|uniref:restriction endonuclease n=1 Tax=Novosphingobium sp. KACC 22771 TaxID=3025670 RepID=UPI0023659DBF|nr:restriction endonuclease [Novosphingobium sp. KACC 22771]WDF73931.1 hypothetical protein PQ467_07830 [Novosphingobium sp. KACC 22771]
MTADGGATPIAPGDVRYIKLGVGGGWARQAFENGWLAFGYHSIPDAVAAEGDWNIVAHLLRHRPTASAISTGVGEVEAFYGMGADCLWITLADGHLWWTFADPEIVWLGTDTDEPSRYRRVIGGWRNTDIHGRPLRTEQLSSKLTQVAGYRGTICKVAEKEYLVRRINGIVEPIVVLAGEARERVVSVARDMIRSLHWADFETLVDLIFARSGWQRSTRVGAKLTDVDIVMEQPTTDESAFVQIKSKANQAILDDYLDRYEVTGHDHFFFVCHTVSGTLKMPEKRGLHLFAGQRLADVAVRNGLFDWLIEKSM